MIGHAGAIEAGKILRRHVFDRVVGRAAVGIDGGGKEIDAVDDDVGFAAQIKRPKRICAGIKTADAVAGQFYVDGLIGSVLLLAGFLQRIREYLHDLRRRK